jgi:beta-lactamase superfamily II metal-dependent hydrolase
MKIITAMNVAMALTFATAALHAAGTLDIYWADVEGGAGTLIVTPAGESILVDTGMPASSPGKQGMCAERIHAAAVAAGVSKIDFLVTTHFHLDHFGGAADLAQLMPIGQVLDNGIPGHDSDGVAANDASFAKAIEPYRNFKADGRAVIQAGQVFPLKQNKGSALITLTCIGARKHFPAPPGAPFNAICSDATHHAVDTSDNANSIVMLLKFGPFRFFIGGDLTWNMEGNLVCPYNVAGTVDVYQVDHHGLDLSNNPLLVRSLRPTVAVMSNGPRKGAMPETMATLRSVSSIQTIWQIHRNTVGGKDLNTETNYIANMPVNCDGNYIKCSVDPSGKSYTVSIPASGVSKTYASKVNLP